MPCPVSSALTARIPKNNALLVTIFLISGFIHITSELVLVKVYVRGQGNMTFQQLESQAHDYRLKPPAVLEPNGTGICRNICIWQYHLSTRPVQFLICDFDVSRMKCCVSTCFLSIWLFAVKLGYEWAFVERSALSSCSGLCASLSFISGSHFLIATKIEMYTMILKPK